MLGTSRGGGMMESRDGLFGFGLRTPTPSSSSTSVSTSHALNPNVNTNTNTTTNTAKSKNRSPPPSATTHRHGQTAAPTTTRLACDICRERKVRCDRDWPRCGRCARLGDNCSYRGRARHRLSQADLPRQLRELHDRLEQAEARLSTQQQQQEQQHQQQQQQEQQHQQQQQQEQQHQQQQHHQQASRLPGAPTLDNKRSNSFSASTSTLLGPIAEDLPVHNTTVGAGANVSLLPSPSLELDIDFLPDLSKDSFDIRQVSLDWLNSPGAVEYVHEDSASTQHPDFWNTTTLDMSDGVLSQQLAQAPTAAPSPPGLIPASSSGAGSSLLENQFPPEVFDELYAKFFGSLYPTMPILSRAGFFSLVRDKPDAPQVQALMYGLGLLGAMVSPEHHHLQAPCLRLARRYVELCEQDDELMISLELFQALLCIIRYELTHRTIQRAWLTVGRAVRLGHILGLHLNNAEAEGSEVHHGLPTTTDAISLEERRRAFWTLYICETYASSRARLPPLLQEDHITVPLPSPGVLTTNFVPCAMATLRETYDARRLADCRISAFAGVILACAIARRCQPHAEAATISGPSSAVSSPPASALSATKASSLPPTRGFWDRQFSLLTLLRHRFELLGPHLTVRAVQTDSVSFALYVYLCGIDIALQEAAVAQAQKQDFSPLIVADSAKRSRAAAYRLVGVAQGMLATTPSGVEFFTLHGAFIARPLAIAMKVLGRDLTHHEDDIRASSKVAVSLHLLLGALDRTEERDGFWHHMIEPVIRALHEWEDLHGNRPADTWALGLTQGDTTLHLLPPGQSYQSQR